MILYDQWSFKFIFTCTLRWSLPTLSLCISIVSTFRVVLCAWSMSFRFEISEVTEWMVLERINSNRLTASNESNEWFYSRKISFSMQENPLMFVCFNRLVFRYVIKLFVMVMLFFFKEGEWRTQKKDWVKDLQI